MVFQNGGEQRGVYCCVLERHDGQTVYTFIDWNGDFTGSDYSEEYTTTDAAEFQKYIGTYEDSQQGMPFFFQIEDGVVKIILEKQIA